MDTIWESFTYIFKDSNWTDKLFKGGIIGVIPIINISLLGYMVDVINSIYGNRDDELPEFNVFNQFIMGLKIFIISSIYFTVIFMLSFILFIIIFGIFLAIFNLESDDYIVGIIIFLSTITSTLLLQVALSHYTYTNNLLSLLDFPTLYRVLERTWFNTLIFYTVYIIVSLILFIVIGIMLGSCILGLLAIWLIGAYLYYSSVVFGYFSGKIYLQGIEKPTSRTTTVITSKVETSKPTIEKKIEVPETTNTVSDPSMKISLDKNSDTMEVSDLEDILKSKYLELKEHVKMVLNNVKEGEVIKDRLIEDLINKEINTLLKLENLDNFKLFSIDGKPILLHRDGEIIIFTTLGLSLIEHRDNPNFEKIKERIQKMYFVPYKRENRVFFRGFDLDGNRKFSDVRLFIWNFNDINKLKKETERIINGILRDGRRSTSRSTQGDIETSEPTNTISDFPRELLEKYIPLQKLGEGGFGKVFKVKRRGGTLPLAVKVPNLQESAKRYLMKEIEVWRNLNHPNIVKLYDAFTEPIPHIEMEYIEGYKLNGEIIRDLERYPKPMDPKEAIEIVKQIAEGLKHAHNRDIIHRDIKPSNILLTENLTPKITDWGLAKIGTKSTTTGTKGLTLLYSAPEQIDEEEYGKTDKRTDIYQLGVLFYELLTGRLPYEGISPTQISLKIVNPNKKPTPPSKVDPKLSVFDGIFEKLLAKKKEERYQSVDEFLKALDSIEELIREKEKFKDTLTKTTQRLKISTDKKEIEKLTKDLIETTVKLALNCARVNDKVGLLDTLELLRDYVKSEENRKDLEKAISHIEYLIKEGIPIGEDTVERLKVLLNRIKREWS